VEVVAASASSTPQEEERRTVLAYVITQLNTQLFTELLKGFHAPRASRDDEARKRTKT
jgi:hypothetical protein